MLTRILTAVAISWLLAMDASRAQTYNFTTLAGEAGYGYVDGSMNDARFTMLTGVTLDAAGNLYVSEGTEASGNETIRKITPGGVVSTVAGMPLRDGHADGVGTNAQFWWPQSIVSDSQGTIYVADTRNELIREVAPDGTVTTIAGKFDTSGTTDGPGRSALFNNPEGICRDSDGNLYLADYTSCTIRKLSPSGTSWTVSTLAGAGPGRADGSGLTPMFYYPSAVTVDSGGNLDVSDTLNCAIRKVTPVGAVTTFAGSLGYPGTVDATGSAARFSSPGPITIDNQGNLYVVDQLTRIRKITPAGAVTTLAGGASAGYTNATGSSAAFSAIYGISADASGNIYVTDQGNNAVRKITPAGVVTTVTGGGPAAGSYQDGTNRVARFYTPHDIVFGTDGNLYVADGSHAIRKVTPAGVVTTLAGKGLTAGSADGTGSNARFSSPSGMAVDSAGNMFVADSANSTIRKVTPAGVVTTVAGKAATVGSADGAATSVARFNKAQGVAVDAAGNLFVADTLNNTIRKISGGSVTTIAGLAGNVGNTDGTNSAARFNNPYRIIADTAGNLLVSDYYSYRVRKLTPSGTNWVVSTFAGKGYGTRNGPANNTLPGCGTFGYPVGLAFDAQGILFVTDPWEDTIRKVSNEGTNSWVSTPAGIASTWGYIDGSVNLFYQPEGIAVDAAGNLYVADTKNHVIRKGTLIVPAPALQISALPGKIVLSWPLTATGYVPEACASFGGGWQVLTNAVLVGSNWEITNDLSGPARFYRLRSQ